MEDLQNPKWMYVKAALFVAIGLTSAGLLLAATPTAQTLLLLLLVIWSFCRVYYFAFYVIERYIDPAFKFSGLLSALKYLALEKRR